MLESRVFPLSYFHTNFHTSNVNKNLVIAVKSYVKQMSIIAPGYFSIYTISITSKEIKNTCIMILKNSITILGLYATKHRCQLQIFNVPQVGKNTVVIVTWYTYHITSGDNIQ